MSEKRGGCKDIEQVKDKRVSDWPRPEPHPTQSWQCGYPTDCPTQQPPNYDPYKIKVPNVLVQPLPPNSAKVRPNTHMHPSLSLTHTHTPSITAMRST